MALNLQKIKERLERLDSGATKKGFWKVPKGESVVRVIPDPNGDPFKDFYLHYNVGNANGFLCPFKNFGEDCPVCSFASKLWKEGTEESTTMAKKLFVRQRFYSPVLVRTEEDKGALWWSYGKTVYETLLKFCRNVDYGDITDPETGVDLVIDYVQEEGKRFPATNITPRRKSSKICPEMNAKDCQKLIDSVIDINELLDKKTPAQVKAVLENFLLTKDDDVEEVSSEVEKYPGKKEKKVVKKEEVVKSEVVDEIGKAFDEFLGDDNE